MIDLSTTWDRTHPIGLATARVLARLIETAMPHLARCTRALPGDDGDDRAPAAACSATPRPRLDGQRLLLNRRQTEILAILALHPDGLSLDRLHALVYGDQAVTLSTLKAEVSHLRAALGGQLASRPYRLTLPVRHRRRRRARRPAPRRRRRARSPATAATCCPAPTRRRSSSSASTSRSRVREALLANPDPTAVVRYSELAPYDVEVLEVCLAALGERPHPAKPLLKGRLAVAGG